MNGTLQDRLVKELRLRGLSSMADANAYAPAFIADFTPRFGKVPRSDFNAHRPIHNHQDLRRTFCWREWRKVTHSLSLQYDKTLYLLEDLPEHRQLIHRYIEVAEYPDGAIELWADDTSLPYTTHYRYPDVDQAAIVENKRLGHVLGIAQKVQALRDNRHYEGPSRTMSGVPPGPQPVTPGARRQRQINRLDLGRAMRQSPLATVSDDDPPQVAPHVE